MTTDDGPPCVHGGSGIVTHILHTFWSGQLGRHDLGEFKGAPSRIRMQSLIALAASDPQRDIENAFADVDLVHDAEAGFVAQSDDRSIGVADLLRGNIAT